MSLTLKYFVLLFFALVGLLNLTRAAPTNDYSDVSLTSIDIAKTNSSRSEKLVVAIQRVDDLIDNKGNVVAEKISAVIMNFELNDKNVLTVNSQPIELGVTSVQKIEARIVPADATDEDIEKYENNFDIGLVTVEVRSFMESIPTEKEGTTISKITVVVKILELDGVQIIQSNAVERVVVFQFLEVKDDEQNTKLVPVDSSPEEQNDQPQQPQHKPCPLIHSFIHWWKCSSKFFKIFLISLTLTLLFGSIILLLIPVAINNLKLQTKFNEYKKILQESEFRDSEESRIEQVIFIAEEEKHALIGKDQSE